MDSRLIDLSHSLESGMQLYPDDPDYCCKSFNTVEKDGWAIKQLSLGTHTGTHVDAPSHYVLGGKDIDQLPLDMFTGPALVIDISYKHANAEITWADLQPHSPLMGPGVLLLIYTGWSDHWNTPYYLEHPYLTRDCVQHIINTGVQLLGVDSLSPDALKSTDNFPAHELFLGAGNVIAENLTNLSVLAKAKPLQYRVSLIPLKLATCDGSPIRAYAECRNSVNG